MSLTSLSRKSLLKILNCNVKDSDTNRRLRRTRFEINQLIIDADLHKFVAEEIRIQADQELHMANNMINLLRARAFDAALEDPERPIIINIAGEDAGNLLANVADDLQAFNEEMETDQAARGDLFITLRKAERYWGFQQSEDRIDNEEKISYLNPYFFFSEAPAFYEGRMGFRLNPNGISEPLIHRPDYIHREAGYVNPKKNNTRLCRMFGQFMNQVRELKMLSIFGHQIDKDFLEKFKGLNLGYSQISRLNLQCHVDLTQDEFVEFIELFHLDSILIKCVFTKEIVLEEILMNVPGRIIIEFSAHNVLDVPVGRLTPRLLDYWKHNPPRQISIDTSVYWNFAEVWDFIEDIVRQDLPLHRRATYYVLGEIEASTEEWRDVSNALMQRGYIWEVVSNTNHGPTVNIHYVVKHRNSKVTFAFDVLALAEFENIQVAEPEEEDADEEMWEEELEEE